jgi:hypothetical protein
MTITTLDRRINRLLMLLLLTAVYYAVPWGANSIVATALGLPFLVLYTVFVPGVAIDRFLENGRPFSSRGRDILQAIAAWVFYGLSVLLLCAFVWTLSGVSIDVFAGAVPVVVAALALSCPTRRRVSPPAAGSAQTSGDGKLVAFYAVVVAAMFVLVLWAGPSANYDKDTLDHIGYTNEVARTGEPFPLTAVYHDPGPDGADLRKGLLHAVYGYYKSYLAIDTLAMFRVLGAAFLAFVMLAVYSAALSFFGSRAVATLAGVLFVLAFDGGIRSEFIRLYFYPNRFAVGYLLLFLSAALGFLGRPRAHTLVLCAVFAFAASAVHIQYTVLIGFAVLTILVWKPCFDTGTLRTHVGRTVALGLAAFMGMLPYGAFRYLTAYQASDLHRQIQGAVFVTDRLFIFDPVHLWHGSGFVGLASILAIVPLWRRRRVNPALGYLIASTLTVLLIQLNPVVMPVFYRYISYLVQRLGAASPFYILAAYFLVTGLRGTCPGEVWGRLRRTALTVAVIAAIAGVGSAFTSNALSPATIDAERQSSAERWAEGLALLNEIPGRVVIASDPVTSYFISAYTPHYVACTYDQHAPPNDLMSRRRTIAARDILSPFTSASDKNNQASAHGVTHVVVNEGLDLRQQTTDYWTVSGRTSPLVLGRISDLTDLYEEVGFAGGFRLYKKTNRTPGQVRSIQNPMLRRRIPGEAVRVDETAGLARCAAAQITTADPVAAGEQIEVTLYWSREEDRSLDKYMVAIRFDRADLELPFEGKPFTKLARKLKERMEGERYRFRDDHKIVDGFFNPDVWPPFVNIVDRTTITIPRNVAEGRYTVRAKLITSTTSPNYRLRDYLFDDDVYHGVEIGQINVIKPREEP